MTRTERAVLPSLGRAAAISAALRQQMNKVSSSLPPETTELALSLYEIRAGFRIRGGKYAAGSPHEKRQNQERPEQAPARALLARHGTAQEPNWANPSSASASSQSDLVRGI